MDHGIFDAFYGFIFQHSLPGNLAWLVLLPIAAFYLFNSFFKDRSPTKWLTWSKNISTYMAVFAFVGYVIFLFTAPQTTYCEVSMPTDAFIVNPNIATLATTPELKHFKVQIKFCRQRYLGTDTYTEWTTDTQQVEILTKE